MASIFISSPFFSSNQNYKVAQVERALTANPTVNHFYSARWNQRSRHKKGSIKWGKQIYNRDINGLKHASVVVAILDFDNHDTDSGTAFELGFAKKCGKYITAIKFDKHPTNLMIGVSCNAYFNNLKELSNYDFNHLNNKPFKGMLC